MSYTIRYADSVIEEDIPVLPKSARLLIQKAIEKRLTVDPIHYGKPLRYSLWGNRRLRVSDYQVIYCDYHKEIVFINAIDHRKDVYVD